MAIHRGQYEKSDVASGLRHKAAILASVIVFAALVLNSLFGDKGLIHLMAEQSRLNRLRRQVEELRNENAMLAREIAALRSDPRAIERIAREELGLAKKRETIFLVQDEAGLKTAPP